MIYLIYSLHLLILKDFINLFQRFLNPNTSLYLFWRNSCYEVSQLFDSCQLPLFSQFCGLHTTDIDQMYKKLQKRRNRKIFQPTSNVWVEVSQKCPFPFTTEPENVWNASPISFIADIFTRLFKREIKFSNIYV